MLGIFDSGLGGLTVLRHLRARLPGEDVVYFADQAHVPYGDRDDADLARLLEANVASLRAAGADAIVMGCNTSCAVAARRGWPEAGIPILDIIAAAADATAASGARRIGVVATTATARSGAYGSALRARDATLDVQEVGAPELVPLVEAGTTSGPVALAAVREALAAFVRPLDAVVLACTHYPLLDDAFAEVLGPGVLRVDPALAQAERAAALVRARAFAPGRGRTRYLTTGALAPFRRALERIVGPLGPHDEVAHVPLVAASGA
jgi:glutamate racemase